MTGPRGAEDEAARSADDEAIAWALRAHDQGLDPHDPALAAWLSEAPSRRGALLRAQAALSLMDRARVLGGADDPDLAAGRIPTRRVALAAAAAGVVVAAGGALAIAAGGRRYRTALGEVRSVPLADGSTAVINTRSVLEVAMRNHRRDLRLLHGEAWFEVAKDPRRPFLVAVGDARVRAVGTAFSVRAHAEGAEVMVTEGVVEAWVEGEARRTRVAAGSRSLVAPGSRPAVVAAAADIQRQLSWRTGEIWLQGETLQDAAAEFNRYNERRLVIGDPALARERFVGLFRTTDPSGFAAAVGAMTGAPVRETDAAIYIGPAA